MSCPSADECIVVGKRVLRYSQSPAVASVPGRVSTLGLALKLRFACRGTGGQECRGTIAVRTVEKLSASRRRIIGLTAGPPSIGRSKTVLIAAGTVAAAGGLTRTVYVRLNPTGARSARSSKHFPPP